jgi:membrane-associated phospholipid phosphatase
MQTPILFYKTQDTIKCCFSGKFLVWQGIAIALTALLVLSGFDWYFFTITRAPILRNLVFPAIIAGAFLPIMIPLGLLLIGKVTKDKTMRIAAWGIGQAALYGWILSAVYKSLTGRIPPVLMSQSEHIGADISRVFQFGFMRGGVFWGWPSSHTTVAFAMAAALYIMFPKNKILYICAFAYALYVGLGISVSIHWFSEFAAGAIFGSLVGLVVGKAFKHKLNSLFSII